MRETTGAPWRRRERRRRETYLYLGPVLWGRAIGRLWTLAGLAAALGVAAGCIPAAGPGNSPYVLAPYLLTLAALISLLWLMVRLTGGKGKLQERAYRATVEQFRFRGWAAAGLGGVTVLAEAVYLAFYGHGGLAGGTAAFLLLMAGSACAAAGWTLYFGRLNWG